MFNCVDCKAHYCRSCFEISHKSPLLRHHTKQMIDQALKQNTVNKNVFCTVHANELVKLNCRACNKMICLICKSLDHAGHKVEEISEAINRVSSILQNNKRFYEKSLENIRETDKNIREFQNYKVGGLKTTRDIVNQKHDEIVSKLEQERDAMLSDIDKDISHCEINASQSEISLDNSEKKLKQKIAWVENTLACAQGASLLQELQAASITEENSSEHFDKVTRNFESLCPKKVFSEAKTPPRPWIGEYVARTVPAGARLGGKFTPVRGVP